MTPHMQFEITESTKYRNIDPYIPSISPNAIKRQTVNIEITTGIKFFLCLGFRENI